MKSRGHIKLGKKKKKSKEISRGFAFALSTGFRAAFTITQTRGNYKFTPRANIESARSNGKCFFFLPPICVRTVLYTRTTIRHVCFFGKASAPANAKHAQETDLSTLRLKNIVDRGKMGFLLQQLDKCIIDVAHGVFFFSRPSFPSPQKKK